MKQIIISRHPATEWSCQDERLLRGIVRNTRFDIHRLHNLAYMNFPERERESIRRKAYRIRKEFEYIDTVNHVKTQLLGA